MAIRRLNPWTDINDIDFTTLSILRMGTSGADTMRGGAGRDTFYGYGSDDTFIGNGGVDKFFGGEAPTRWTTRTWPPRRRPRAFSDVPA